jgi:hypothetical protein
MRFQPYHLSNCKNRKQHAKATEKELKFIRNVFYVIADIQCQMPSNEVIVNVKYNDDSAKDTQEDLYNSITMHEITMLFLLRQT